MTFTASTADRDPQYQEGVIKAYKMAAVKVYKGDIVIVLAGDGYARSMVAAASGATGDMFVGVAMETVDNSGGSAGDLKVRVWKRGEFQFDIAATASQTAVGDLVFSDGGSNGTPTTVIGSASGHDCLVGSITELVSGTKVRVWITPDKLAAS